jgi:hypothetical protein
LVNWESETAVVQSRSNQNYSLLVTAVIKADYYNQRRAVRSERAPHRDKTAIFRQQPSKRK